MDKRTMLPLPGKSKGIDVTVTAATTDVLSNYKPSEVDGNIIGVSVSNRFTAALLSLMYITIAQGSREPLKKVPLDQLLPSGERFYFPFEEPLVPGTTIDIKITDDSSGATLPVTADPLIIFHFERKNKC